MHIKRVELRNVATIKKGDIDLPSTGLVLITGANGSGKTTLAEAISQTCHGKAIVGAPVWVKEKAGSVSITFHNDLSVLAKCTRAGNKSLGLSGPGISDNPTATKAKAILSQYTPSHEVWVNSCFMSVQTMARFGSATDKARKDILEELMGWAYFDVAADFAEKEQKAKAKVVAEAETKVVQAQGLVNSYSSQIGGLSAAKSTDLDPHKLDELRELYKKLAEEGGSLNKRKMELTTQISELRTRVSAAEAKVSVASAKLSQLQSQKKRMEGGTCPTCGQAVAGKDTSVVDASIEEAQKELGQCKSEVPAEEKASLQSLETEFSTLNSELMKKVQEATRVQSEGVALSKQLEHLKSVDGKISEAQQKLEEAQQKLEEERASLQSLKAELEIITEAREALGVRGVRAHLMTATLEAITSVANSWISQICGPGVSISLYEAKDKIQYDVHGWGGGYGYKGCSLGQTRRLDVGLMLAFGEVARQALNQGISTIIADEPFLGLDTSGIETVTDILRLTAREHCVVCITNEERVANQLIPDMHYHVKDGEYRRVS